MAQQPKIQNPGSRGEAPLGLKLQFFFNDDSLVFGTIFALFAMFFGLLLLSGRPISAAIDAVQLARISAEAEGEILGVQSVMGSKGRAQYHYTFTIDGQNFPGRSYAKKGAYGSGQVVVVDYHPEDMENSVIRSTSHFRSSLLGYLTVIALFAVGVWIIRGEWGDGVARISLLEVGLLSEAIYNGEKYRTPVKSNKQPVWEYYFEGPAGVSTKSGLLKDEPAIGAKALTLCPPDNHPLSAGVVMDKFLEAGCCDDSGRWNSEYKGGAGAMLFPVVFAIFLLIGSGFTIQQLIL